MLEIKDTLIYIDELYVARYVVAYKDNDAECFIIISNFKFLNYIKKAKLNISININAYSQIKNISFTIFFDDKKRTGLNEIINIYLIGSSIKENS